MEGTKCSVLLIRSPIKKPIQCRFHFEPYRMVPASSGMWEKHLQPLHFNLAPVPWFCLRMFVVRKWRRGKPGSGAPHSMKPQPHRRRRYCAIRSNWLVACEFGPAQGRNMLNRTEQQTHTQHERGCWSKDILGVRGAMKWADGSSSRGKQIEKHGNKSS